jgi:hypothetical protein
MSTGEAVALRLDDIDLTNPDSFVPGYPHEAFRLLRAEAPVYWHRSGAAVASGSSASTTT